MYKYDWTTPYAEMWLKYLANLRDVPARGIEIGCYEGRTSVWFCENVLTHPDSQLICIDPFAPNDNFELRGWYLDKFLTNIKAHKDKVHVYATSSQTMLRQIDPKLYDQVDFAYIDGDHHAATVLEDAVLVWRFIKPGGIVIFDDNHWQPTIPNPNGLDKPALAINAFCAIYADQLEVLENGTQVIVRKQHGS